MAFLIKSTLLCSKKFNTQVIDNQMITAFYEATAKFGFIQIFILKKDLW